MRTFSEKFINYVEPLTTFFLGLVVISLFISVGMFEINAQKRKPAKKSSIAKESVTKDGFPTFDVGTPPIESLSNICVPPESEYVSSLYLDKSSNLTLSAKLNGDSKILVNALPITSLDKVLSGIDKKSIVTIKADPSLSFDSVVKVLKSARQTIDACVNIEASSLTEDPYVYYSPEPKENQDLDVKPNPLTLIAQLGGDGKISLNNEEQGSVNDTTRLTSFLQQIFKQRSDNGVFRENSVEVETTVFVKSVTSSKFGDVIKLVDALKKAGAFPIGLQIDDLAPTAVDARKEMIFPDIPAPKKPRPRP